MQVYDISRALSAATAVWPGDTPFHFELRWKMSDGASVNVGAIETSLHNGTHADASFHFDPHGLTIERMPLDAYIGPAVVIDLTSNSAVSIRDLAAHEADIAATKRLLLKTNAWPAGSKFPETIPAIAADVADWLGQRGVKLLGVDAPSVDALDSKDLRNHHALAARGIAIVESLDLSAVAAGVYNFAALPLKISGADGAPVRAVLWRE